MGLENMELGGIPPEELSAAVRHCIAKSKRFSRLTPAGEEDLFQEAMLALLEAKERYNTRFGAKFHTYASHSIDWAIQEAIRRNPVVYLSEQDSRKREKIPTVLSLAEFSAENEDKSIPESALGFSPPVQESDQFTLDEILGKCKSGLTGQQLHVLEMYRQGMSFQEMAELLGCSRQAANQLYARAIQTVQKSLGLEAIEDA